MTRKQLLRLAALAQGAAVISVAGCNQTPDVSAPLATDRPPTINAPPSPSLTAASNNPTVDGADAAALDASGPAIRPHPPYLNAPPRPLPTTGPQP